MSLIEASRVQDMNQLVKIRMNEENCSKNRNEKQASAARLFFVPVFTAIFFIHHNLYQLIHILHPACLYKTHLHPQIHQNLQLGIIIPLNCSPNQLFFFFLFHSLSLAAGIRRYFLLITSFLLFFSLFGSIFIDWHRRLCQIQPISAYTTKTVESGNFEI